MGERNYSIRTKDSGIQNEINNIRNANFVFLPYAIINAARTEQRYFESMENMYSKYNGNNKNILKNIIASAIEETFLQYETAELNMLKVTGNTLKMSTELSKWHTLYDNLKSEVNDDVEVFDRMFWDAATFETINCNSCFE